MVERHTNEDQYPLLAQPDDEDFYKDQDTRDRLNFVRKVYGILSV